MSGWAGEARRVLDELHPAAVPERRERAASYVPSAMEVLGVPVPALRTVVRRLQRELRQTPAEGVLAMARALLDQQVHEARQIAYEVVGSRPDVLLDLDGAAVEALGAGNDNWASVDSFCVFVSGQAWREGRVRDDDVRRWAASHDRWWRRTAIVSTVPLNMRSRGGTGDTARTLDMARRLAGDTDPMVAKGLSWALRSLAPVDPEAVRAFLAERGDELPSLVRREVSHKLETGRKNPRP